MLYTSYLSKMNKIPDTAEKILITRLKPRTLDTTKYGLEWIQVLAPSEILLAHYKSHGITKEELFNSFRNELQQEPAVSALKEIRERLKTNDVYLICYEKNVDDCHRKIVAEAICNLDNSIEYEEYKE